MKTLTDTTAHKNTTNDPGPSNGRTGGWGPLVACLVILVAGCAAFANSFPGVFVLDDVGRIAQDESLSQLDSLHEVLSRRRPVVDYTLALNHAVSGNEPWSYHLVNLTVHLLAGLTLFGLLRRTLLTGRLRKRFGAAATPLALTAAMLWVVHPVQTQSVTYVIQRAESMMGLFYLLTLYAVVRGASSRRPMRWSVAAVVACALGMGSKAVMVTAPLTVLLFDRCFLSTSFRDALTRRWGLYLGLSATWLVLVMTGVAPGVLNTSAKHAHVGFGYQGIAPWTYLATQLGVVVHYLYLSVWPRPLCLDYGWPAATTFGAIAWPLMVVGIGLAATWWAMRRSPAWGFVGVWFFLILSPTSSFIPIKDAMFEHRVYLPSAAVMVSMVMLGYLLLDRIRPWPRPAWVRVVSTVIVVLATASLAYATHHRNRLYQSESAMWADVIAKRPLNARAYDGLGSLRQTARDLDGAIAAYREAVSIDPAFANAHYNLGTALLESGHLDEAVAAFREAIALNPDHGPAYVQEGNALAMQGRFEDAVAVYRELLDRNPRFTAAYVNTGNALYRLGRFDEAVDAFGEALRLDPNEADTHYNLGNTLLRLNRIDDAIEEYREAIRINRDHPAAYSRLGMVLLRQGDRKAALSALLNAARLAPEPAQALRQLGSMFVSQGHLDLAAQVFFKAVHDDPNSAVDHYNLGTILSRLGRYEQAISEYEAAINISPSDVSAYVNLGETLVLEGQYDEAVEAYKNALTIEPHHKGAEAGLMEALTLQDE